MKNPLFYESKAASLGHSIIAGLDEAGVGPWAGPVVASAVVVNGELLDVRVDDSKKLTPKMRDKAFDCIIESFFVGVGIVDVDTIDEVNIFEATRIAMEKAIRALSVSPECLLVDGRVKLDVKQPAMNIIGGDGKSYSIACASIISKVTRDRIMEDYDKRYPQYGFKRHKGYGTPEHQDALERFGPCPIHRRSYLPIKRLLNPVTPI